MDGSKSLFSLSVCFQAETFNILFGFSVPHSALLDICLQGLIAAHVYVSGSKLDLDCWQVIYYPAEPQKVSSENRVNLSSSYSIMCRESGKSMKSNQEFKDRLA